MCYWNLFRNPESECVSEKVKQAFVSRILFTGL